MCLTPHADRMRRRVRRRSLARLIHALSGTFAELSPRRCANNSMIARLRPGIRLTQALNPAFIELLQSAVAKASLVDTLQSRALHRSPELPPAVSPSSSSRFPYLFPAPSNSQLSHDEPRTAGVQPPRTRAGAILSLAGAARVPVLRCLRCPRAACRASRGLRTTPPERFTRRAHPRVALVQGRSAGAGTVLEPGRSVTLSCSPATASCPPPRQRTRSASRLRGRIRCGTHWRPRHPLGPRLGTSTALYGGPLASGCRGALAPHLPSGWIIQPADGKSSVLVHILIVVAATDCCVTQDPSYTYK